jgi:hypothetical protein
VSRAVAGVTQCEQVIGDALHPVEVVDVALQEWYSDYGQEPPARPGWPGGLLELGLGTQLQPVALEKSECLDVPAALGQVPLSTDIRRKRFGGLGIEVAMEAVDDEGLYRNIGLLLNRITIGASSILGPLYATADWTSIDYEIRHDGRAFPRSPPQGQCSIQARVDRRHTPAPMSMTTGVTPLSI